MYGPSIPITYAELAHTPDDALWAIWLDASLKPTVSTSNISSDRFLANELPSNHDYSAIRCDKDKGFVTLRNLWGMVSQDPLWGTSNGGGEGVTDRGDGVFDISFVDWKTYFIDITAVN